MSGSSKRVIYDADTYLDAIELVSAGLDELCAVLPILDALRLASRWTPTEAQALSEIAKIVRERAEDVSTRALLAISTGRGE